MSTPMIVPVLQHMQAQLLTISPANGYYNTITVDQILDIRKDLITEGSQNGPNVSMYVTGWDKLQPGDQANYGQVIAQVHMALDFAAAIQTDPNVEILQVAADLEKAIKQDYSQGGTCKTTTSPNLQIWNLDASGWFIGSLTWDVWVPWGENDPSSEFSTLYN